MGVSQKQRDTRPPTESLVQCPEPLSTATPAHLSPFGDNSLESGQDCFPEATMSHLHEEGSASPGAEA